MGTIVNDHSGARYGAKVDSDGRVAVSSVSEPSDRHTNAASGKVWSLPFKGINPTAGDDYVFYLKNTGTADLYVTDIRLSADTAASEVEINTVTGTAGGSTSAVVPVSRTVGSSATPEATALTAVDITGLTKVGTLFYMELAVVDTLYHIRTTSGIRIPKDQAIAILVETATANITGVVSVVEGEGI